MTIQMNAESDASLAVKEQLNSSDVRKAEIFLNRIEAILDWLDQPGVTPDAAMEEALRDYERYMELRCFAAAGHVAWRRYGWETIAGVRAVLRDHAHVDKHLTQEEADHWLRDASVTLTSIVAAYLAMRQESQARRK